MHCPGPGRREVSFNTHHIYISTIHHSLYYEYGCECWSHFIFALKKVSAFDLNASQIANSRKLVPRKPPLSHAQTS